MQNLSDIFGYCIIPKSTLLYRGHKDISHKDCMFFTTKYVTARAFGETIQVWKTTSDIKVLFLVEYLTSRAWGISSLPKLFNHLFPAEYDPKFTDLDIKHWDINRRDKVVRKLFDDYKISGWFSSIEGRIDSEVCLFDKQVNARQIYLVERGDINNKLYFKDSLERMEIFPTETFYSDTATELNKLASFLIDESTSLKRYKRFISGSIKYYIERGYTKDEAKHYMFNLRTKLKI